MRYLFMFLIALVFAGWMHREQSNTIYVIPSHVQDKDDVIHSVGQDVDCWERS